MSTATSAQTLSAEALAPHIEEYRTLLTSFGLGLSLADVATKKRSDIDRLRRQSGKEDELAKEMSEYQKMMQELTRLKGAFESVGGNLGRKFGYSSSEDLMAALQKMLENPTERAKLTQMTGTIADQRA